MLETYILIMETGDNNKLIHKMLNIFSTRFLENPVQVFRIC